MVFSSIPSYLDPSNWQQQQQQHHHLQQNHPSGFFHHGINNISSNPSSLTNPNPLLPPPPLPPPQQPNPNPPPHTSAPGPLIRPGSMAERARMANIPMPEIALKCPRCESTNTKFCYFNNYSLSQPRHFCKTCRRYWTRGGALRTVPVGGGCRRNKRSKSSSSASKSSAANAATSSASSAGGSGPHADMMGLMTSPPPPPPPLRFMTPMHHHLSELGDQLGLSSYGDVGFHLVGPTQFPFLGGLDGSESSNLYGGNHHSFDQAVEFSNLAIGGSGGLLRSSKGELGVKVERGHQEMSLITRFNNNQHNGEDLQYNNMNWGGNIGSNSNAGNGWTDLSAINNNSSCSTTSAL